MRLLAPGRKNQKKDDGRGPLNTAAQWFVVAGMVGVIFICSFTAWLAQDEITIAFTASWIRGVMVAIFALVLLGVLGILFAVVSAAGLLGDAIENAADAIAGTLRTYWEHERDVVPHNIHVGSGDGQVMSDVPMDRPITTDWKNMPVEVVDAPALQPPSDRPQLTG